MTPFRLSSRFRSNLRALSSTAALCALPVLVSRSALAQVAAPDAATPPQSLALPQQLTMPDATAAAPQTPEQIETFKGGLTRSGETQARVPLPLNLLWRHTATDAPPGGTETSPLVLGPAGQRRVYFAAGRNVYSIDGQTGERIWRSADYDSTISSPLTLMTDPDDGDLLLGVTSNGQVSASRAVDGTQVWVTALNASVTNFAPTLATTGQGERILLVTSSGQIIALTRAGQVDAKFSVRLGEFGSAPTGSPALTADGRTMFIPCSDGRIYVLDLLAGRLTFTIPVAQNSNFTPAVIGDRLVAAFGQRVAAFDTRTGNARWSVDLGNGTSASPSGSATLATSAGAGAVFTGTNIGAFYGFDLRSGKQLWKVDLGSAPTGTPLISGDGVLVGTQSGELFGLDGKTGAIRWRYRLDASREIATATGGAATPIADTPGGGNPGGGNPGGRGGGRGFGRGGVPATETRSFGVSSAPAAIDGGVYVLADSAQLFAFDAQPFDAAPPLILQPSLSILNSEGGLNTSLIAPNVPQAFPGNPPVYFSAQVIDPGSGFDPASARVTLDATPLETARVTYDATGGALTVVLIVPPAPNIPQIPLPDGTHTFTLTGRDFRGNAVTYSSSFAIDNSLPKPAPLIPTTPTTGNGNGRGGGGRGGGGGFGRGNGQINPGDNGGDNGDAGAPGGFPGGGFPGGGFPGGGFPGGGFPGGGFPGGGFPGGMGETGTPMQAVPDGNGGVDFFALGGGPMPGTNPRRAPNNPDNGNGAPDNDDGAN